MASAAGGVFRRASARFAATRSPGTGRVCASTVTASRRRHTCDVGPDPRARSSRSREAQAPGMRGRARTAAPSMLAWDQADVNQRRWTTAYVRARRATIKAPGCSAGAGPAGGHDTSSRALAGPRAGRTTFVRRRSPARSPARRLDSVDGLARPLRAAHERWRVIVRRPARRGTGAAARRASLAPRATAPRRTPRRFA